MLSKKGVLWAYCYSRHYDLLPNASSPNVISPNQVRVMQVRPKYKFAQ